MSINNLHGIENVQARQIADITNVLYNNENPPPLSDMQDNLMQINDSMGVLNDGMKNVLSDQINVKDLVQRENQRLEHKQEQIDEARESQNRMLNLNDSYRKRYSAYLKMIAVLTIALVIVWLMRLLPNYLPFIPSIVFDIVVIIVVFLGFVVLYFQYTEIQKHNPLNYDELNYPGPEFKKIGIPTSTPTPTPGTGFGPFGCIGPQCCGPNTVWDEKKALCRKPAGGNSENAANGEQGENSAGLSPEDAPMNATPEYTLMPFPKNPNEGFQTQSNGSFEFEDYAKYA